MLIKKLKSDKKGTIRLLGENTNVMTKYDYLTKLKAYLQPLPPKERSAAIRYYDKYFTDAGPENEYNVIINLGSPKHLAEKIMSDKKGLSSIAKQTRSNMKKAQMKLNERQRRTAFVLTIVLFPVWGGLLAAVAFAIGVFFLFAVMLLVAIFSFGIAVFCMGVPNLFSTPSIGAVCLGSGIAMASAAVLLISPVMNFVFYIIKTVANGVFKGINRLISGKAVKS